MNNLFLTVQVDGETPAMLIKLSELALTATIIAGVAILIHGLLKKTAWKTMLIDFLKVSIICSTAHTPLIFVTFGDAIINFVLEMLKF
jgi:hypothetical protein